MIWVYVIAGWTTVSLAAIVPVARVIRFHEALPQGAQLAEAGPAQD